MTSSSFSTPSASPRDERGQGLLEFALILPLLLVLLLGIIDFGRLFFLYSEVSSAVREAIRFSAVNPYDCVGIRDRARSTLSLTDASQIDLIISFDNGSEPYFTYDAECTEESPEAAVGDRVTVRASLQVNLLTADIIGPLVKRVFGPFAIDYTGSRTIVPADGVETGPTSTPLPTRTPPPGASLTPTRTRTPTPTHTPQPPEAPSDFDAIVKCQNKSVDFTWQEVPGATLYRVYRADTGELVEETTGTHCSRCDDLGTSQNRAYYVVAVNGGGESAASPVSTVTCGAGATDTPTPTNTATPTPTPTSTPTNTSTPTQTPTPSLTSTPRPTRTPTPSPTACPTAACTPTPTLSGSPTSTAPPAPELYMTFMPGYPARKTAGSNKRFWVKVKVTDLNDNPMLAASVSIVEPASYAGATLAHLGNGVYGGMDGGCFAGNTNANTFVRVRAVQVGYQTAEVAAYTDSNPASSHCP